VVYGTPQSASRLGLAELSVTGTSVCQRMTHETSPLRSVITPQA
jgi:hypothetical protein